MTTKNGMNKTSTSILLSAVLGAVGTVTFLNVIPYFEIEIQKQYGRLFIVLVLSPVVVTMLTNKTSKYWQNFKVGAFTSILWSVTHIIFAILYFQLLGGKMHFNIIILDGLLWLGHGIVLSFLLSFLKKKNQK